MKSNKKGALLSLCESAPSLKREPVGFYRKYVQQKEKLYLRAQALKVLLVFFAQRLTCHQKPCRSELHLFPSGRLLKDQCSSYIIDATSEDS